MDELFLPESEFAPGTTDSIELATVAAVGSDGVKLLIEGNTEAGEKEYKVNAAQLIKVGDRARISRISGSYVVEFILGTPMSRYPIPPGGNDGDVLTKDGTQAYAVKWAASRGIPAGGSDGQVLTKDGSADYAVKWATPSTVHGIPSGGTNGQVLAKSSNRDYEVSWITPSSGGDVSQLKNGNYILSLDSSGNLLQGNTSSSYGIKLGTSRYPMNGCYIGGNAFIACSSTSYLGFFGTSKSARIQTVSSSASVSTLITALKAYNLIQ